MTKYHIVPTTGEPGRCEAQQACRYGSPSEHFTDLYEARAYAERSLEEQYGLFGLEDEAQYEHGETYEDELGQEWTYDTSPYLPDPSRPEQAAVAQYWAVSFDEWTTSWLNPSEANGMCTDSAEAFTAWANAKGLRSYVLDKEALSKRRCL